jgi:hypothetical protein
MFTITNNFAPAHPLLGSRSVEKPLTEQKGRIDVPGEPETRLWKLTAETVSPKLLRGELLVLFVFLAIAVSATVISVQELSRLMKSNAIEHVAARVLLAASEK